MGIGIKEYRYFSESEDSEVQISCPFSIDGETYALLECGEIHVLDRPDDKNNAFSCLANIYPEGVDFFMRGEEVGGILMAGGRVWSPRSEARELIDSSLDPLPCGIFGKFFLVRKSSGHNGIGRSMLIDVSYDESSYSVIFEHGAIGIVPESCFFYTLDGNVIRLFKFDDSQKSILEVARLGEKPGLNWGVFGGEKEAFFISPEGLGSVYDSSGNRKTLDLEEIFQSLGVSSIRHMRHHKGMLVFIYYNLQKKRIMAVIDLEGVRIVWQSDVPKRESYFGFVIVKNYIFSLHEAAVSMIDLADGSVLWRSVYRDSFLDQCRQISSDMVCFWSQSASGHGVFLDLSAL